MVNRLEILHRVGRFTKLMLEYLLFNCRNISIYYLLISQIIYFYHLTSTQLNHLLDLHNLLPFDLYLAKENGLHQCWRRTQLTSLNPPNTTYIARAVAWIIADGFLFYFYSARTASNKFTRTPLKGSSNRAPCHVAILNPRITGSFPS